eukprot:CAMPEP_0184683020 /NCGR_PEP_ID=MMETSP0312-20130426/9655_1 /TAXON_ID=31354 /ORGANISM="Compsopogon coeruleus, Strain SAG 36.94" /LENGTH=190 /DNA_ID=CAMNT_0027135057 /DNA_START=111 /DNA_END=680 /DNA_ORIENTATION=-
MSLGFVHVPVVESVGIVDRRRRVCLPSKDYGAGHRQTRQVPVKVQLVGDEKDGGAFSVSAPPVMIQQWRDGFAQFVQQYGPEMESAASAGFQAEGPGAVFANFAAISETAPQEAVADSADAGAVVVGPFFFMSLGNFRGMNQEGLDDPSGLGENFRHIVRQMEAYDPETQFVVVFQHGGVVSCDIVQPTK